MHLEKCDVIAVTIRPFSGKETKLMAVPDPSSCVFYHFTRKFDDSEREYRVLDKDWSTTFKFVPPCRNELLRSKTAHLDG